MNNKKVEVFSLSDHRREILDITFPDNINIPFEIRQLIIIRMSDEAVKDALAVGNHFHTIESEREEYFVMVGPKDEPLFKFRYREDGEVKETDMFAGDSCYIPPGVSHSFIPLTEGACIFGLSNQRYDSNHHTDDILF